MTWWARLIADIGDWYPGSVLGIMLTVLVLSLACGLAIQPRGFFARKRNESTRSTAAEAPVDETSETLPALPLDALTQQALAYQAAGNYRMAVREWLRVMVRDLVDHGIIENRPGWTVTELAGAAGTAAPAIAGQLREATDWFSQIWYGDREANIDAGSRMRQLHTEVAAAIQSHETVSLTRVEGV